MVVVIVFRVVVMQLYNQGSTKSKFGTDTFHWQVAGPSHECGKTAVLLVMPEPNGEPRFTFSIEEFRARYPQELDPALH